MIDTNLDEAEKLIICWEMLRETLMGTVGLPLRLLSDSLNHFAHIFL